jgi:SAM-dependent methyltransferase
MKVCQSCQQRFQSSQWNCPGCGGHPDSRAGFICLAPDLAVENAGFSSHYFAQLSEVEANHFWFRSRNGLIQWALRRHFPTAKTFLEVGCGTGFVLSGLRSRYPEIHAMGTDIFTEGLNVSKSRLPGTELFQMDARCMPFDSEFDVIGAFDTLEHIEDDKKVLQEFFRSCKPGGGIILTVPQHPSLWSAADEHAFHKRRYTRRELISKIRDSGFEPLRVTSFVFFLLPLMLASRRRRQKLDSTFDNLAEFRIRPALNRTLEWILFLEKLLIETGISLPAGGSLLAVARRPL